MTLQINDIHGRNISKGSTILVLKESFGIYPGSYGVVTSVPDKGHVYAKFTVANHGGRERFDTDFVVKPSDVCLVARSLVNGKTLAETLVLAEAILEDVNMTNTSKPDEPQYWEELAEQITTTAVELGSQIDVQGDASLEFEKSKAKDAIVGFADALTKKAEQVQRKQSQTLPDVD